MKPQWNTASRLTLCALALAGSSMVSAQMQPAPPMPAAATMQGHAQHPASKIKPRAGHRGGHHATPQQHEAAAVAGERRQGKGPANPPSAAQSGTEFERNALRRCDVFKTDDDRRACVERVRQPKLSGSVEEGGVIREYTQTVQVPVKPAAAPMQPGQHPVPTAPHPVPHSVPGVAPQPHMAPTPMAPMRK